MIELAPKPECTACGACAYVCPKSCISMQEDKIGQLYPIIDSNKCIECKRCQNVCPILNEVEYNAPKKAFAAWSSDPEERRTSASGGIAAEIYKAAIYNGYYIAGAVSNKDFSVSLELSKEIKSIANFKNSKYVFSSAYSLFSRIKESIANNENIVVIGLPCQIAALRKIFKDNKNLFLADVVCHGATPYKYLDQHIKTIENKTGQKAEHMYFRDPEFYTNLYTFSLYNSADNCFFAQRTKDGDTYQYGYHRSISYRENCFHCHFAKTPRVSDVTLSDYTGLGKLAPCSYKPTKVSSILVNTDKGNNFILELIKNNKIVAEQRPLNEPVLGDPRLRLPNIKSYARLDFERLIRLFKGDFERTMSIVIPIDKLRKKSRYYLTLPIRVTKKIMRIIKIDLK